MRQVPVLIAGGGPVGMTLAYELAARGIECMLVERNPTTTAHPKMDITNARSMEIFRRLGLVPALRAVAVPESHNFDVAWVTSMTGRELHRFRYPSVVEARAQAAGKNDGSQPTEPPMRVSQVEIEPVLKQAIDHAPEVAVRFGVAFESLVQDGAGVTATLRDARSGAVEQLRCAFLVGCDGGGSVVRQCLDIGVGGEQRIMPRFMTHFRSEARSVLQRWGVAWHYQSPLGTLIAQNDRDLWTLHSRLPDTADSASVDPAQLLRAFIGTDIDHEVLVANRWSPHLLVANAYRRGRVLIAGDAAHQYIPTGGYGMNTGIGDACDLGWKLAATLQGFGGAGLLDSYESERRPVGLRNREASRTHNATRLLITTAYREVGDFQAAAADSAALARLATRIGELGNAENESTGIELGYAYADSAIVCSDPDTKPPDDPRRYVPTTVPGVRLPNVFLEDGTALHDRLGAWFTLLGFGVEPCPALVSAAAARGVSLNVMRFDQGWLAAIYGGGLLLVRPDQHIAWRGNAMTPEAAEAVLARVLGHPRHASRSRPSFAGTGTGKQ